MIERILMLEETEKVHLQYEDIIHFMDTRSKQKRAEGQVIGYDSRKVQVKITGRGSNESWVETFLLTDLLYGIEPCRILRNGKIILDKSANKTKKIG